MLRRSSSASAVLLAYSLSSLDLISDFIDLGNQMLLFLHTHDHYLLLLHFVLLLFFQLTDRSQGILNIRHDELLWLIVNLSVELLSSKIFIVK
jgi:hypothetical protein